MKLTKAQASLLANYLGCGNTDETELTCKLINRIIKLDDICKLLVFTDKLLKTLYNKAKYLYYEYYEQYHSGEKVLDFSGASCCITSNDLYGFYTPNDKYINCIAFINGKAVILERGEVGK